MFQRESYHPHEVHWHAGSPYHASTSPCLPSASQLETASIPTVIDSLILAVNVVHIQTILALSRISCTKSTCIRRDCGQRSCKAYCLEAGGYQSPSYMSSIFTEQWPPEQWVRGKDNANEIQLVCKTFTRQNTSFWCMYGSRYVISAAFAFVANLLAGSCRAHRRRISRKLHMAALCPRRFCRRSCWSSSPPFPQPLQYLSLDM